MQKPKLETKFLHVYVICCNQTILFIFGYGMLHAYGYIKMYIYVCVCGLYSDKKHTHNFVFRDITWSIFLPDKAISSSVFATQNEQFFSVEKDVRGHWTRNSKNVRHTRIVEIKKENRLLPEYQGFSFCIPYMFAATSLNIQVKILDNTFTTYRG